MMWNQKAILCKVASGRQQPVLSADPAFNGIIQQADGIYHIQLLQAKFEFDNVLVLLEYAISILQNTHQLKRFSPLVPCSQVPSTVVIDVSQESMGWMKFCVAEFLMVRRY